MHRTTAEGFTTVEGKRYYIDQDLPSVAGSVVGGKGLNAIQEELAAVMELNGIAITNGVETDPMNQVYTTIFAAAKIGTAALTANAVTTAKILDANVTAVKIAASAVTTAKILDANVTTGKIAASAVTSAKIAASAVTSAKILNANVTSEKIAASAVTAEKLDPSLRVFWLEGGTGDQLADFSTIQSFLFNLPTGYRRPSQVLVEISKEAGVSVNSMVSVTEFIVDAGNILTATLSRPVIAPATFTLSSLYAPDGLA